MPLYFFPTAAATVGTLSNLVPVLGMGGLAAAVWSLIESGKFLSCCRWSHLHGSDEPMPKHKAMQGKKIFPKDVKIQVPEFQYSVKQSDTLIF